MKFDKAVPILYSTDVKASVRYFIDCLKFEHHWMWREDPCSDESPSFAGIHRDDVEIFFCKDNQGGPGTWLSLMVTNVDDYYELIKDSGAKITSPPETKSWNMREMLVECPDGHMIRIGHNTSCD